MSTIPASDIVLVNPSVLGAGGSALDVIGLMLTSNTRVPIGTVASFGSAAAIATFFGSSSQEAALAATYFAGFTGANKRPAALLFAQYNAAAVGAYLRGGNISALTLAQLQALNGTLSVTINGVLKTGTVNLSAATSFSNAAVIIADTLDIEGAAATSFTGVISGTVLTASAVTGTLAVGQFVHGSGVTAGTYITSLGTGTGGAGTYNVSASQTVGSEAMTTTSPAVTYDSVSGAFVVASSTTGATSTITFGSGAMATSLLLTSATGAVLSQGAAIAVPATFMEALIAVNANWVTFMTTFDPDGSGNTLKLALAAWKSTKNNRFAYVCWDLDASPTTTLPATSSLGYLLANNNDSGTCLLEGDPAAGWDATAGPQLAAFVCGAAASIDFTQANGRITFAFKEQAGLVGTVITETIAANLGGNPQSASRGNGYNFYGAYGAANQNFIWFQRGFVTGPFLWFDAYINQIWLNNSFQISMLNLLQQARSIPYNTSGNALIAAALADPTAAGLNFGAFAPGTISASQIQQVNTAAGADVATTLQTQGSYLQILAASSTVRAARGSPPMTFFYLDRGSVQALALSSVAVQ